MDSSATTPAQSAKRPLHERLLEIAFVICMIGAIGCNGDLGYGTGTDTSTVTTSEATNLTAYGASLGGAFTLAGDDTVTSVGIVFSRKSDNPDPKSDGPGTTTLSKPVDGTPFTFPVTGLVPDTEYVYRAGVDVLRSGNTERKSGELRSFTTGPGVAVVETNSRKVIGESILATSLQTDGRVLLGGKFTLVGGRVHGNLVRLNPGGAIDATFNAFVSGERVATIAAQADGKFLIGGVFDEINGTGNVRNLARLDASGGRDATFVPVVGDGPVECLAIQADGKILVGGSFVSIEGNARYGTLARLNPDGTLDPSFNPGTAVGGAGVNANGTVRSVAIRGNGTILIAGDFTQYNGTPRAGFAQLNSDGTLDPAFNPGFRPDAFAVLPDEGKILVGAYLDSITPPGYGVARLLEAGTKDPAFATADTDRVVRVNGPVHAFLVAADGSILMGGPTLVNGTPTQGVARLTDAGVHDVAFERPFDFVVSALGFQADGGLVIGGAEPALSGEKELIAVSPGASSPSTLGTTSSTRVEWLRDGGAPEVSQVTFDFSTDNGATWTSFGSGSRISGGWEKSGAGLPASGLLRARGRTKEGGGNASSGLIEEIEDFPIAGASDVTLANPTVANPGPRTVTLGAEITSVGSVPVTERGVVVTRTADNANPFLGSSDVKKFVAAGTSAGAFTTLAIGLVEGTHYTFRGYATTSLGTRYSAASTFVTLGAPIVSAPTVTAIGTTSATLGGSVDSDGGSAVLERGIFLTPIEVRSADRLASKDTSSRRIVSSGTTGVFTQPVDSLLPGTAYRFSAYAVNAHGTSYSASTAFTTQGVAPSEPEPEISETEGAGTSAALAFTPSSGEVAEAGAPGSLDDTFDAGEIDALVQAIAVQPDGSVLIAGEFDEVRGEVRSGLARLDSTGLLDLGFTMTTDGIIYSLQVRPDGRLLIGGLFGNVNGVQSQGVALLEADGTMVTPTEFDVGAGVNGIVYTTAIQDDGKILVGGLFDAVQGVTRGNLARLHADGTLDETFAPAADDAVYSLAVQADGKILVGGNFQNVNSASANRIARLEVDGARDATFSPGSGANGRIAGVGVQPDGKILVCGDFTLFNTTSRNRIARLNANGGLDTTFTPGTGANGAIYTMAQQTDGRIMIGGVFQSYNGTARNRIARLLATGVIDPEFDPGAGADGEVSAVALQEDGGILIGGDFANVDGEARSHLARFENAAATETFTVINGLTVDWLRGGAGPELQDAALEFSNNGGLSWEAHGTAARILGGWRFGGEKLPLAGLVRARGNTAGGFLSASAGLVEATSGFDHADRVAALEATLSSANASSAKLLKQIKAAKKKKNTAKVKKLTKQLKAVTARINATRGDLANY